MTYDMISPLGAIFNAGDAPDTRVWLGYALLALTVYLAYKSARRVVRRFDKAATAYVTGTLLSGGALTNVGGVPGQIASALGLA